MNIDNSGKVSGVGFFGLLTLLFIALKLCKVIDWPWIWVLAPFWIPIAVVLLVLVVFIIFFRS